jgi:hypothetical protein
MVELVSHTRDERFGGLSTSGGRTAERNTGVPGRLTVQDVQSC